MAPVNWPIELPSLAGDIWHAYEEATTSHRRFGRAIDRPQLGGVEASSCQLCDSGAWLATAGALFRIVVGLPHRRSCTSVWVRDSADRGSSAWTTVRQRPCDQPIRFAGSFARADSGSGGSMTERLSARFLCPKKRGAVADTGRSPVRFQCCERQLGSWFFRTIRGVSSSSAKPMSVC